MKIDIYNDGVSFVTNEVSTVPVSESNLNETNRIKFVTDLAAVSRGKSESNNPLMRYKMLLKEAAPANISLSTGRLPSEVNGSPSRPLEFLPIVIDVFLDDKEISIWPTNYDGYQDPIHTFTSLSEFNNKLGGFSYLVPGEEDNLYRCYTNMRACLNAGIPYEHVPYNKPEEVKDFIALKANVPMFVWAHIMTHTAISKESQSDRVSSASKEEYWFPTDLPERAGNLLKKTNNEYDPDIFPSLFAYNLSLLISHSSNRQTISHHLRSFNPRKIKEFLKVLGYPKEIYSRATYYFRYKKFVMTGWKNDPYVWDHLLIERSACPSIWKNWTQKETKQFVKAIKSIINKGDNPCQKKQ